ncbi:MAG: universal stress protein [Chitinivibrionales bacterium]|nr:universal stress protein [Chitinivibrionales bacterium]MBD3396501.1 universal stress protein [Chitinivibrionales bacterium]
MRNILAAVDFSDVTQRLIKNAALFAHSFDAHLWLVHVAPLDGEPANYDAGPQEVRDNVAKTIRKEHKELRDIADDLEKDGATVTALMVGGDVSDEIVKQADKTNADMIVIGSHGKGGILDSLMGSICQAIVRKATVPVTVVPSREK